MWSLLYIIFTDLTCNFENSNAFPIRCKNLSQYGQLDLTVLVTHEVTTKQLNNSINLAVAKVYQLTCSAALFLRGL